MFNKILISLTNSCQNNCFHCTSEKNHDKPDTISLQTIKNLSPLFNKNIEIGFCGGEPLLAFPLLQQITEYFEENFSASFHLFTNGILMDTEHQDYLKAHSIKTYFSLNGPPLLNLGTRPPKDMNQVYLPTIVDNYFDFKEKAPDLCGISSVIFKNYLSVFMSRMTEWLRQMNPTFWKFYLDCFAPLNEKDLPVLSDVLNQFYSLGKETGIIIENFDAMEKGILDTTDAVPLHIQADESCLLPIWGRAWNSELTQDCRLGKTCQEIQINMDRFNIKYGALYQHPITQTSDKCNLCNLQSQCCKKLNTEKGQVIIDEAAPENCLLLGGFRFDSPN